MAEVDKKPTGQDRQAAHRRIVGAAQTREFWQRIGLEEELIELGESPTKAARFVREESGGGRVLKGDDPTVHTIVTLEEDRKAVNQRG